MVPIGVVPIRYSAELYSSLVDKPVFVLVLWINPSPLPPTTTQPQPRNSATQGPPANRVFKLNALIAGVVNWSLAPRDSELCCLSSYCL